MHTLQRHIPVLLEDAKAKSTSGQGNASLQYNGRPSYAVQLQQLGSNNVVNYYTPQARCLPQKPPAIDIGHALT